MPNSKKIFVIDSHTMGEPTRIIMKGFPDIVGKTISDKKDFLQKNYDNLRRAIMNEPRGHRDMFGAILSKPTRNDADLGVIFMDGGGYLNMCGHGSMGVATVAVERNLVPVTEPYTNIVLETPAGLVHAQVEVNLGKVGKVSIINVPAFLYQKDALVHVPELGDLQLDIAFGGNFFALVDTRTLHIPLERDYLNKFLEAGLAIRNAVNAQLRIQHPLLPHIHTVDLVEFYAPLDSAASSMRNLVVFGEKQVDRSPCGTGTSAKIASLYARKKIKLGESFISESFMGTRFIGRVLKKTLIGNYPAVIPEITGRAYVTGENTLILNDADPFEFGFDCFNQDRRVNV